MKLIELAQTKKSREATQVFESYFGTKMPVNRLTLREAQTMLTRVRGVLAEHQRGVGRHTSERNPAYLKLVMMEQALEHRVNEDMVPPAGTMAKPDPAAIAKLKTAKDKLAKGQTPSPEEQELINAQATLTAESRLLRAYQFLKESEVQQAQVVLAAQDMVDKMQSMLEDTTEMQFKELPALVDSIRNQIGMEQATQFNTDVTAALQGLVQNLQGSKQQLETALGVVTGQPAALDASMVASGMPGPAPGEELGTEMDADVNADIVTDVGAEMDAEGPAATAALGRARR